MKRLIGTLTLAMAVTIWAGPAASQTQEEFEAFGLYKSSKEDLDAGRLEEAIQKLERAYELFPMPHILIRKAEAYWKKGDMETALDLFQQVKTEDPKVLGKVRKAVSDILYQMNQPVDVHLSTNVDQVEVTVDHTEKYIAPCALKLNRGRHHFEYKKNGYWTVVEDRIVGGGGSQTFAVELREQSGNVVFVTDLESFDGVLIRMDSREIAPRGDLNTPNRSNAMQVRAGSHQLLCVKEGLAPFLSSFEVAPNVTVEVNCKLRPPVASNSKTWAWVTLSTGLASTAAGVALVAWYYSAGSSQPSHSNPNLSYQVTRSDYHENYYGFALLGVGVAVAGLSSYFFLADQDETSRASGDSSDTRFGLGVAPVEGGAVASGYVRF